MSLKSSVTETDSAVRVVYSDHEDRAKAKLWMDVEVPRDAGKVRTEEPHETLDRWLLGKEAVPRRLQQNDLYRLAALHRIRDMVKKEIDTLEKP